MTETRKPNYAEPAAAENAVAVSAGQCGGLISEQFQDGELVQALAHLPEMIASDAAVLVAGGRNQNVRIDLPYAGQTLTVLVKAFGRQSKLKDWIDLRYRGSKAQRSYAAASHLQAHHVATPAPVAYIEHRQGYRLRESFFISVYESATEGFHERLINQLRGKPTVSSLFPLLTAVAELCRKMHDAGFMHLDLGNQNILVAQNAETKSYAAQVIDLNRGRMRQELTLQQRGQDLSRLNIPGELMRMFLDIYWRAPAPTALVIAHQKYQSRFRMRARTRKLRHPFREARIAREERAIPASKKHPQPKDIWIWDDLSDQALSALDRRERKSLYPLSRSWRMISDALQAAPGLWRMYRRIKATVFREPVTLRGKLGIALGPSTKTYSDELKLLAQLGSIPVIVRLSHHESEQQTDLQIQLIKDLAQAGHEVSVALVQDRAAILQSQQWNDFVVGAIQRVASCISAIEFGHAINRVKWGIWDFRELQQMYQPLLKLKQQYPDLPISGPATIDFEYAFLLSAIRMWPADVPLSAISHHLYVDRRGAPENLQGGFNLVDKNILAKAVAMRCEVPQGKVIVSEVNWPLKGTGKYSPVTTPFDYPDPQAAGIHDSGVDEADYADFMIRYIVLSLCSGTVDKIYWWRLVAQGYGLVDISDTGELGTRPAFRALRQFLATLGQATFVAAEIPEQTGSRHGSYHFLFENPDGEIIKLCWNHGDSESTLNDVNSDSIEDLYGNGILESPVKLTGSPIYLRHCNKS